MLTRGLLGDMCGLHCTQDPRRKIDLPQALEEVSSCPQTPLRFGSVGSQGHRLSPKVPQQRRGSQARHTPGFQCESWRLPSCPTA